MPFDKHPKRDEWQTRVAAGEDPKEVGKALGIHRETVRLWLKPKPEGTPAPAATKNTSEEPEDASAPLIGAKATTTQRTTGGKRGQRSPAKAITEATAEKLIEGCFLVAAVMQREEEWLLSDVERKALGPALADTLAIIPSPIANAVNAYAGPTVFMTTLFGIITAKQNAIRKRGGVPRRPALHAVPEAQRVDTSRQTFDPNAQQTPVAAMHGTPAPIERGAVSVDMDLSTAIGASKGSLQDDDERDEAERHLTGL